MWVCHDQVSCMLKIISRLFCVTTVCLSVVLVCLCKCCLCGVSATELHYRSWITQVINVYTCVCMYRVTGIVYRVERISYRSSECTAKICCRPLFDTLSWQCLRRRPITKYLLLYVLCERYPMFHKINSCDCYGSIATDQSPIQTHSWLEFIVRFRDE